MAFEDVMKTVGRLMVQTDAMAAIGAALSLTGDTEADPRLRPAALAAAEAAGATGVDELSPEQRAAALGIIRLCLSDATRVLADPGRQPGWTFTDEVTVEGWGRGSMAIPGMIAAALPDLGPVGSILDVGTGVGWLSVAAAGLWPEASITGVDVWEPSLDRARAHVAEAGLGDRITLRNQDATDLADADAYDLAWLPAFFFDEDGFAKAAERVVKSVRPGGMVVIGRFEAPPEPLAAATSAYRHLRIGGHGLTAERSQDALRKAGCTSVWSPERTWPMPIELDVGRR